MGFPDVLRFSALSGPLADIRRDLTQSSTELVTGRKQELGKVLGAQSGDYSLVAKALADAETSRDRLTLAGNRLSAISIPLKQIREELNSFATQAQTLLINDGFAESTTVQDAQSQIRQILTGLNTSFAGRNLFSGDAVDRAALASADDFFAAIDVALVGATDEASTDAAITAFFAPGGEFDTSIYQGGAGEAASVQLPTGGNIDFSIKADDEAVRTALEGLVRVAYAPDDASPDFALNGIDQIRQAETRLIALESNVGRQQNIIDNTLEAVEQEKTILELTEDSYAGVDAFEAANRVQTLELQLQTAYTVTSRLSRLTLTNFIR
ncbi:MAG: flagellin [Pseudomonadota bacterium]